MSADPGVPLRTRILTRRRGWLPHDEVEVGDQTIGYNPATCRSEWTAVTAVHYLGVAEVWRFGDSRWSAEGTPDHRWLAEKMSSNNRSVAAPELVCLRDKRVRHRIILAREADTGHGLPITLNEAALLGWIAGDGWERKRYAPYGSSQGGASPATFHIGQTKQENWPVIEQALADGAWSMVRTRDGHREWRLHAPYARDLVRRAGHPKTGVVRQVLTMSAAQRAAWLDAIISAEGHRSTRDASVQISQNVGAVADAIVVAVYLSGHTASIYADARPVGPRRREVTWTIGITRGNLGRADGPGSFTMPAGRTAVWCVTTGLGSWTAEQDRRVFLTGNSLGHGTTNQCPVGIRASRT